MVAAAYLSLKVVNTATGGAPLSRVFTGLTNPRGLFPGQDNLVMLIVGEDYNYDRRGIRYSKNNRSDTIMLLGVDLNKRKISAVSIPRDTFARGSDGVSGKINGTFARGGMPLLKETLEEMFTIDIDYAVALKPDAVQEIVDAVGGVTVEAIDDMKYSDDWAGINIDIPKGVHHLKGEEAEGYVRFRQVKRKTIDERGRERYIRGVKSSLEEGDIRRTARQQNLIRALVQAAITPQNIVKADQIIDRGYKQIETDLDRMQILALATIFKDSPNFGGITLPGTDEMSGGAYYWRLDDRAPELVRWLIKGDEFSGRQAVRIQLRNGSGVSGAAREAGVVLKTLGFDPFVSGNAKEQELSTVIYRQSAYAGLAKEAAEGLGLPAPTKEQPDPRFPYAPDVEIVIGKDRGEALKNRNQTPDTSGQALPSAR